MHREANHDDRIRIRLIADIEGKEPPVSRMWALSRPHVAEEISQIVDRLRGGFYAGTRKNASAPSQLPRELHFHSLADPCDGHDHECLYIDVVPASWAKGDDEIEVTPA